MVFGELFAWWVILHIFCSLLCWNFSNILLQEFLQEYHQSAKQFGTQLRHLILHGLSLHLKCFNLEYNAKCYIDLLIDIIHVSTYNMEFGCTCTCINIC